MRLRTGQHRLFVLGMECGIRGELRQGFAPF
jgi:hypothetical protein